MFTATTTLPKADKMYLAYSKTIATCTYFEDITTAVSFSIVAANEDIFLQTENELFYFPTITQFNTLYDVFDTLALDYYRLDITSELLLNHIKCYVLNLPLQGLISIISMNIYSYRAATYELRHGGIITEREKQTCHETIEYDHISASSALSVLN